jgi:hypothetical protein
MMSRPRFPFYFTFFSRGILDAVSDVSFGIIDGRVLAVMEARIEGSGFSQPREAFFLGDAGLWGLQPHG